MMMLSDEEIFLRVKQNDRKAFDELYNRYWLVLFKAAFRRLRDKELCSDLVQDIFADLWNKRELRFIENIKAYLNTAVRNRVYSLLSEGKINRFFVQPFENMMEATPADTLFAEKEINRLLHLWMQTLPEKRREIFRLKYYEGASTRQISEHLQISQKTVQNQLLLAFQDLRGYIAHYLATLAPLVLLNSSLFADKF